MNEEQKVEVENSQNTQSDKPINLAPIPITDVSVIGKYWEKIYIEDNTHKWAQIEGPSDSTSKGVPDQIHFNRVPEAKIALRMLDDPRFKNLIKVDAIAFPAINCRDYVSKDLRWYEEHLYKKGEHEEFIPLAEKRTGFGDPWTDGKFPDDTPDGSGKFLPESCVEVKCPDCNGYGYRLRSRTVKDGHHSVKCPRCLGSGREHGRACSRCGGDGWVRESDYTTEKNKVTCERCVGLGKLRSVLEAHRVDGKRESTDVFFMAIPKGTIPEVVQTYRERFSSCFNALDYKVLSCVKTDYGAGRYVVTEKSVPNVGQHKDALMKQIVEGQKKLDDKRARYDYEGLDFESCIRFVRFHFTYYIGAMEANEAMSDFAANAGLGKVDPGYFNRSSSHMIEMSIWLDTDMNTAWGSFPKCPGYTPDDPPMYCSPSAGLTALLVEMGKAANGGKMIASPEKEKTKVSRTKDASITGTRSQKKRWKFVLLGLLFGWMGAHLMYAKRTFLLFLLWASFIAGVVMCGMSQSEGGAQVSQGASAEVAQESNNYEAIGGGCMALWLLLWLGGTLFIKKDGKGHRM